MQVIVTGGTIRQGDGGVIGATTVAQIEKFRVDLAIIGASAIDADGMLLDFDVREVESSRAIIDHARRVVLVADSSKFSRSAPVKIASLSEIDIFVTDRLPSEEIAEMCRRFNVEVIETGDASESENGESGADGRITNIHGFVFFACRARYVRYS